MMIERLSKDMHIYFATKWKVFKGQHFVDTHSKSKSTSRASGPDYIECEQAAACNA
jgi:hypothetical protein